MTYLSACTAFAQVPAGGASVDRPASFSYTVNTLLSRFKQNYTRSLVYPLTTQINRFASLFDLDLRINPKYKPRSSIITCF